MTQSSAAGADPLDYTGSVTDFAAIAPQHIEPALRQTLELQRKKLAQLQRVDVPTIDWLREPESIYEGPHRVWGSVSHLSFLASTPGPYEAVHARLPRVRFRGCPPGLGALLSRWRRAA